MGNPEAGVRREFEALGPAVRKARSGLRGGPGRAPRLWTRGTVTFHGTYFDYDDVSFFSGTEMRPLVPIQQPPPIWVVSNPRLAGDAPSEEMRARWRRLPRA